MKNVMPMIESMEQELRDDKKNYTQYLENVTKLLAIAKDKNNDFKIVNYNNVVARLFKLVESLANDKRNLSGSFFSENLLTLTLESLVEILDMGLSELHQILETKGKLMPIIPAKETEDYKKILEKIETDLKPIIPREKNWRLLNYAQYGKELVKGLGDSNLIGKSVPIIEALAGEKKEYGKAVKGILNLLPEFQQTYIVDIWEIKRIALSAKTNLKDTILLQTKIGEIREDNKFPLIYAAQETLIQVFIGSHGKQAGAIRKMIQGTADDSRDEEKRFPTLFYFSGMNAHSLEPTFGNKASSVYRHGAEFWYRFIFGLAELNYFIKNNSDIISGKLQDEFKKIINHIEHLNKPESYSKVLKPWLEEALSHGEVDINYLSDIDNETEKGELFPETEKLSKNRHFLLAKRTESPLSSAQEFLTNTLGLASG